MENEVQSQNGNGNKFVIPASIVLAGIIIAGAVMYSGKISGPSTASVKDTLDNGADTAETASLDRLAPITRNDHIRGNLNAPLTIVEFSDTECPFCKGFHSTLKQILDEYGDQVAWVYRHFPLEQLHSKARKEAEATECANELGGNKKFWAYLDRIFEITPSNDGLDLAELPRIAEFVGLNRSKFEACLESGRHAKIVEEQYQDAINSGGTGTPFNIVVPKSGQKIVILGAQPLSNVKSALDSFLK